MAYGEIQDFWPEPLCVWEIMRVLWGGFGWCPWVLVGGSEDNGLETVALSKQPQGYWKLLSADASFALPFRKSFDG